MDQKDIYGNQQANPAYQYQPLQQQQPAPPQYGQQQYNYAPQLGQSYAPPQQPGAQAFVPPYYAGAQPNGQPSTLPYQYPSSSNLPAQYQNLQQPIRYSQRRMTRPSAGGAPQGGQLPTVPETDEFGRPLLTPAQEAAIREQQFQKQVANVKGEVTINTIFVFVLAVFLSINNNRYCYSADWNVRTWLIEMTCVYAADLFLCTWQLNHLKKHRRENLGIMCLRFVQMCTLVGFLIAGNVGYYNSYDTGNGCSQMRTIAFILIIFGYLEMLKCCCIGTLLCCIVPIIFFAARQQQQPSWVPTPPTFVQNLYHTKFKPPANAPAGSELECSICLLAYTEEDEIIPLPCDERHFFHASCITQWLETNNCCPLCKAPVTQEALAQQQAQLGAGNAVAENRIVM